MLATFDKARCIISLVPVLPTLPVTAINLALQRALKKDKDILLMGLGVGDPKNIFALGGSAGGLLMGAVINYEPELYKGIISAVPFVDVLTTMSDESIPLTTFEYKEWGNPKNKEEIGIRMSGLLSSAVLIPFS